MSPTIARDEVLFRVFPFPGTLTDIPVKRWSMTLDQRRSPYIEGTVVFATADGAGIDMSPYTTAQRGVLVVTHEVLAPTPDTQTRTFQVVIHAITIDKATGETTLTLRSYESRLIDYAYVITATDRTRRTYTSARALIEAVLSEVLGTPTTLEASPAGDYDITRTTDATNLVRNPRVGTATTDWSSALAGGGAGTFTASRQTSGGPTLAPTFYRVAWTSAHTAPAVIAMGNGGVNLVSPGRTYRASVYVRTSQTSRSLYIDALVYDASNNLILDTPDTAVITDVTTPNTWRRYSFQFTAPANAVRAVLRVVTSGAQANGATWDVTGWRLSEQEDAAAVTPTDLEYFDGATVDAHYAIAWTGTAHLSTSTRTRLDTRALDLLDIQPGQKAWDYLATMLAASGLRLFCDEARLWRLVSSSYAVAGTINVEEGENLTAAEETIDRAAADRAEGYAVGIVIRYQWIDQTGTRVTKYDAAGVSGIGYLLERDTPYPGAGEAAAVLAAVADQQRQLPLSAITDLDATPSMTVDATVPDLAAQTGILSAVTFQDDGTMRLELIAVEPA